jgi:HPt (histidine-containing phosphotransfer) domain-containing protein
MGNESLYEQLCRSFSREHWDDGALISEALETGDFKQARRLAHTLKSSSGLIGAKRLRDIARNMEDALAADRTGEALEKLGAFQAELQVVLVELKDLAWAAQAETAQAPQKAPDGKGILPLCEKLIPLLRTGNTHCLDYLAELKALLPPLDGPGQILVQQIESFDFPAALITMEGIQKEWVQR